MVNFKNSWKCTAKIFLIITFSGYQSVVFGQQAGEVKDQEFIIRKDRVLTLPQQPRKFERIPVLPTPKSTSSFNYNVQPYLLSLPAESIKPEAAQKQWPKNQEELLPGFVRLGFGNYTSPVLEARYNLWEDESFNFGAKVKHDGFYSGPVGGNNSAENINQVKLDGSLFKDFFQLYGGLDYDRHQFKFYGYDPTNEFLADYVSSQNTLNNFKLRAGIQDNDKMDDFNFDAGLFVRTFNDQFEARENEFALKAKGDFWFDDDLSTGIHMDMSLTSPKDEFYRDISRNYFKINPFVQYKKSRIYLKIGANIVFENDDALNKRSDFHLLPQADAHYMLADEFGIYAGFEGDVLRKTYWDFVQENPFLGPSERLLNTIQNYKAKVGVKGVLNDELTYEAGFAFGKFTNMHFFINNPSDSLRFNMVYDDDSRVVNYNAKIGWHIDKTYRLIASANYYYYNISTLGAAFMRPEWEISINNNFIPMDKLLLQLNANLMGGIQGLVNYGPEEVNLKQLPTILDLQLKADYQITDRFSAFAVGNNLLNRNNQRFLNYPVRGIQGILGITFKF